MRALLDFIAKPESGGSYTATWGHKGDRDFSNMSLDQVIADSKARGRKYGSGATGRYQFMGDTLKDLKGMTGLTGNEPFTNELQDMLGVKLLERRGLGDYQAGRLSPQDFAHNLSKEWAGLPRGPDNQSFYAGDKMGNAASVGWDDTLAAISGAPMPDVRMASDYGGMTTGSTNPMDVTGDPRTGSMDMPYFPGMAGPQSPAAAGLIEAMQRDLEEPKTGLHGLLDNDLFRLGANIMAQPGRGGNWMQALGGGLNQTAQDAQRSDLLRQKQQIEALKLASGATSGVAPTSVMKNHGFIQQQEAMGSLPPGSATRYLQEASGISEKDSTEATSEKEWNRYKSILEEDGSDEAEKYWQAVTGARSPEQAFTSKLAESEGRDLPKMIDNSVSAIRNADDGLQVLDRLQGDIAELYNLTDQSTTGLGSYLSNIPSTDAKTWQSLATTIKSNLALDEMKKLKSLSTTGATGFGAMNEKELELLITNIANLDQAQDPAVLKRNIQQILETMQKSRQRLEEGKSAEMRFYEHNNPRMMTPRQYRFGAAPTDAVPAAAAAAAAAPAPASPAGGAPAEGMPSMPGLDDELKRRGLM